METNKPSSLRGAIQRGAQTLREFVADECGVTAVEYAMLAAVLMLGVLSAFQAFGTSLASLYADWVAAAVAAIAAAV